MDKRPHISIMEEEFAQAFSAKNLKIFVDGTVGAGGHAKRILEEHPEIEHFYGFDQDPQAIEIAGKTLAPWSDKVKLFHANFVDLDQLLQKEGVEAVDGFFLT